MEIINKTSEGIEGKIGEHVVWLGGGCSTANKHLALHPGAECFSEKDNDFLSSVIYNLYGYLVILCKYVSIHRPQNNQLHRKWN